VWPALQLGPLALPTYALWVGLAFVVAWRLRSVEVARLGYDRDPRQAWVGLGAMVGAMVGAKLGLVLFGPWSAVREVWAALLSLDFTGKTVLGGILGGWVGVEIAKACLGIRTSTGDGFALPLLVGQAIGRLGCLFEGCCYGIAWQGPWAVPMHGTLRHPVQLYEAALDLLLAAWLFSQRRRAWPAGHAFRRAVVGYALVRAALDPLRADGRQMWGPLSLVQWACLLFALIVGGGVWWRERRMTRDGG
jgi:phosphatidylglycerol:prolipoprotein diacylglycerol transferase